MSKYRSTWHLNEFTLVHTVRYLDPKNGKRFAAPYKTKEKAQAKMDQLKRDGVKDISITQDTLRGNIKFKEDVVYEDTDQERLASLRTRQMELQTKVRDMDPGDPKTKTPMAIAKNDIENIQLRMDKIKDKLRRQQTNEMLEVIDEEIKSDDDYQAKKKALQDIQNDPKAAAVVGREKLIQRKDKLQKDYAAFKSKMVDKARLTASATKEFEKDLAAEAVRIVAKNGNFKKTFQTRKQATDYLEKHPELDDAKIIAEADLTKGQIKKVHKMADDLPKKDFKDRYGKEKGDAVRYATATNIVKKKLGIGEQMNKEHPAKAVYEQIAGLKKKAEKSGMPYSILKKVYDRGMAAWRGGHRPGTTQQQWAFARVNSFVTKSSGTWGGADKDLAKQVRGGK